MDEKKSCLVIHGVGEDGERFRPSDWIERISASVARFGGDRRLRYDARVLPVVIDGERCLYVSPELAHDAPQLYNHIVAFAAANRLRVEQGACRQAAA
ncbi:MAG: DUF3579 domain-containing protein [Gammaproteobacteria bacterium]|nr:DUF3579 domain-containing protein [Gammaproteobacteria bacterium]MCW8839894.1 DUF3579 domain-containing protein [Gammaproteobacteria bacterium]MCW8928012.1 DUF3579 domain-containing protein [Gammaproteobacteria bacterium]MCW8959385.1 DUF3579 domain-containing protein [Gammaproteobacteria bacterium]MCW8972721.1 DUF3579 domain-containing protein [Gammaproteobacteria bacterium]